MKILTGSEGTLCDLFYIIAMKKMNRARRKSQGISKELQFPDSSVSGAEVPKEGQDINMWIPLHSIRRRTDPNGINNKTQLKPITDREMEIKGDFFLNSALPGI